MLACMGGIFEEITLDTHNHTHAQRASRVTFESTNRSCRANTWLSSGLQTFLIGVAARTSYRQMLRSSAVLARMLVSTGLKRTLVIVSAPQLNV